MPRPLVAVVMGSKNDFDVMKDALVVLEELGIPYEARVLSAHRTPEELFEYVKGLRDRGVEVVIAGAGGAAHLPGVIASLTLLPVIGVPIARGALGGLDALLSMVQMPSGIPVAVVGVDSAKNAAILAARILALKYPEVRERLEGFMRKLKEEVLRESEVRH